MSELFGVEDLRQRSDENELDLSLMQVSIVPVHQIAALRKITSIDLSCNLIVRLPEDFCSILQNLLKLDLSKNQIVELPKNIGMLQHLQHLDLYQNQLSLLPVGFSQLNKLKWLDLKDNPLDQSMTRFVGNCLDDKQCKQCAKKVVAAMKSLIETQERQRKKQISEQKKQEALKKEEERKLLEQKKKKHLANERKRKQKQAKLQKAKESSKNLSISNGTYMDSNSSRTTGHFSWFWFLSFTLLLIALCYGVSNYCEQNVSKSFCKQLNHYLVHAKYIYFQLLVFLEELLLLCKVYFAQGMDFVLKLFRG